MERTESKAIGIETRKTTAKLNQKYTHICIFWWLGLWQWPWRWKLMDLQYIGRSGLKRLRTWCGLGWGRGVRERKTAQNSKTFDLNSWAGGKIAGMGKQELTGEEGYLRKVLLQTSITRAPQDALGHNCPTEFFSQGGRAQPLCLRVRQSLVASSCIPSRGGAQPSWQDTVTQLRQLCLGRGQPSLPPRPMLPAAGTWVLRSADGDLGGTPAAPTTRMLRID